MSTTAPAPRTQWLTFDASTDRRGTVDHGPDPHAVAVRWRSPTLDGLVYGQVLVSDQSVVAATESDTVYSLAASDGHVVWSTNLGQPVPRSSLPCGNIDPTGITSTPVVDPATGTIYVVAFVLPAHHELVALDLQTGAVRWRKTIDPPGLSPLVEQQRSALTLGNGRVYIAFGGLFGDCGSYKGSVVSLSIDGSGPAASWIVPTSREGGLWAPSGPAIDASGNLYVSVGNAASTDSAHFDYGNSVVRLTPDLQLADWWAPTDWAALSAADRDLGSQGPVLLGSNQLFVAGKSGIGYILSTTKLGGLGGQLRSGQLCSGAFGASASNGSTIVVACSNGLVATSTAGQGSLSVLWRVASGRGGPPVIADATAWYTSNDGHVRAVDMASGQVVVDTPLAGSLVGFPGTTVTPGAVYATGSAVVTALG